MRRSSLYMSANLVLPVAVALFVFAMVTADATANKSLATLALAGVLTMLRGVLMLGWPLTVLAPLARREAATPWGRGGLCIEHRFGAVMLLIIGAGWTAAGIAYGVGL